MIMSLEIIFNKAAAFKPPTMILLLVVGLFASEAHQVVSLDSRVDPVELRNIDSEHGHPRAVYNQRHLSPHRMMHFGKRPLVLEPPSIPVPSYLADLDQLDSDGQRWKRSTQQMARAESLVSPGSYPYLVSFELGNGRALEFLPDDIEPEKYLIRAGSRGVPYNLKQTELDNDSVVYRLAKADQASNEQDEVARDFLRQVKALNQFERLVEAAEDQQQQKGTSSEAQDKSQSERAPEQDANSESVGQMSTRSMAPARANSKQHLSVANLLFRSGSPSFSYNKKNEPKSNMFMHFGRK